MRGGKVVPGYPGNMDVSPCLEYEGEVGHRWKREDRNGHLMLWCAITFFFEPPHPGVTVIMRGQVSVYVVASVGMEDAVT